eukprot:s502_g38.t1
MQYVRARDLGQYPGLFMPYTLNAEELSSIIPFASDDLCRLLCAVTRSQQLATLWTTPLLTLLQSKCLICGFEAADQMLSSHLQRAHSLALNSAGMLQAQTLLPW